MNAITRRLLWLSIPVVLCATIWGIAWRRSHPAPTGWDANCRAILRAADSVAVTVEVAGVTSDGFVVDQTTRQVTKLLPDALLAVAANLNVTDLATQPDYPCADGSRGCSPALFLSFCKDGQVVAQLSIMNQQYLCYDPVSTTTWTLHPTSVHRLREFIRQHPVIEQAARDAGVKF